MPNVTIHFTEQERAVLEAVRQRMGLETIEQAADWLAKSRLRRSARHATGRSRALYPVLKGVKP